MIFTMETFRKKLEIAEGRSEFVIVSVCDIREFSQFSVLHESPDIAMFIKRFYLKLINEYFTEAIFAKPTGDGLLLIFRYTEKDLLEVSDYVINTSFKVVEEFPIMFKDDPMINFKTPDKVGFGISRGTACCLFSARTTLDYSGQILNLAARLNDFARPKGVIIDGNFLIDVVPKPFQKRFKSDEVYIRGIAEDTPRTIYYSSPEINIPFFAKQSLSERKWESKTVELTVSQLSKMDFNYRIDIEKEPVSSENIKVEFLWPNKKIKHFQMSLDYSNFEFYKDALGNHIRIMLDEAKNIVKSENLTVRNKVLFRIQYVAK